jgi:DNA repair exonuclease SbcCD ATPase subunit
MRSGKTNLIRGVLGAITGDFGRLDGKLEASIRQTAQEDEPCYVEVVLADGESARQLKIKRSISPSGHYAEFDGKKIKGKESVNNLVESWFDVPIDSLGDHFFDDQGNSARLLLDLAPKARSEAFMRLFRLDRFEEVCDELKKFSPSSGPSHFLTASMVAAETRLINSKNRQLESAHALNSIEEVSDEQINDLTRVVDVLAKQLADAQSIEHWQSRLGKLVILEEEQSRRMDSALKECSLVACTDKPGDPADSYEELQFKIRGWDAWHRSSGDRTKLDSQIAALEAETAVNPGEEPEIPSTVAEETRVTIDLLWYKNFTTSFDQTGITECPTCKTPTSVLSEKLPEYRQKQEELSSQQSSLVSKREDATKKNLSWKAKSKKYSQDLAELNRLRLERAKLDHKAPPVNEKAYRDKFERLRLERETNDAQARNVSKCSGELDSTRKEIILVKSELDRLPVGLPDLQTLLISKEQLAGQLKHSHEMAKQRSTHLAVLSTVTREVDEAAKAVEEARLAIEANNKREAWLKEVVEPLLKHFHRDQLPREILNERLTSVEAKVNKHLPGLEVDYLIKIEDDLSLTTRHVDGSAYGSAKRLSGGERDALALAWRFAVHEIMANKVGFMCLDEPTAHFDADRQSAFRDVLKNLRDTMLELKLQLVVVTHDSSHLSLFDKVVNLGSKENEGKDD